jgi:uncharacterized BrkB/YihY/UPF0761 family membrane protein
MVDAYDRDRRFAGGLLSGGLAFRLFLFLLPFSLVVVTLFQGFSETLEQPVSELARNVGLATAVAGSVGMAADASERSWFYLLLVGVVVMLWAGIGVVKAMRLVSGLAWEVDPRRPGTQLTESGILAVGSAILFGLHQFLIVADFDVLRTFTLVLLESTVLTALMTWIFWQLPHDDDAPWTAMIPGALLVTVGIAITRIATIVYFAPRLERVDDLYGALGFASVFLAWLYIIGRLLVAGVSLNATTYRAQRGRLDSEDSSDDDLEGTEGDQL